MARQRSPWSDIKDIERSINTIRRNNQQLAKERAKERDKSLKNSMINEEGTFNNNLEDAISKFTSIEEENCYVTNEEKNNILNYYKNLKKEAEYPEYYPEKSPSIKFFYFKNMVFKEIKFLEKTFPKIKNKRIQLEKKATEEFKIAMDIYNKKEKENKEIYLQEINKINKEIEEYNRDIIIAEHKFLNNDAEETEKLINKYLEPHMYELKVNHGKEVTNVYKIDKKIKYNKRVLSLDLYCFSPDTFKQIPKKARLNRSTFDVSYTYFTQNEINKIYQKFVMKISFEMMYRLFFVFDKCIDCINLNVKVKGINPANGRKEELNILSARFKNSNFNNIEIDGVNLKQFFQSHGARFTEKMAELETVEPFIQSEIKITNNTDNNMLENIDYNVDGFEFERLSGKLLLANGFENIKVTTASQDYGADIIAYKDDVKYAIQCKKYSEKVGVKAVQEVIASKSIYGCHVAVVLTNNYFTPNAVILAKQNNVLLWDRDRLEQMVYKLQEE